MGFANITILGNLGGDPEMRYTPNGKPVTSMSVAVSHAKPDGNGGWKDEHTDWYRVTVWGDRAERVAEQFRKGDKALVAGRFQTREFEGRDGGTRLSLEINSTDVVSPKSRREREADDDDAPAPRPRQQPPAAQDDDLSDLPF